jgi:phosphotransacetylase
MNLILELHEKARRANRRIVLPESQDSRVRQAAAVLAQKGICQPVLVDTGKLGTAPAGVEVVRPASDPRTARFAAELHELRKAKGMSAEEARQKLLDPLYFGAFLVRSIARAASAAARLRQLMCCARACRSSGCSAASPRSAPAS